MLSPLTGFVDGGEADASEASRHFAALVAGFLADAPRFQTNREEMERALAKWRDARPAIEAITRRSGLRDVEPLAAGCPISLRPVWRRSPVWSNRKPRTASGVKSKWRYFNAAKPKPSAVEFAILPSVRQLVIAAIELPQLRGQPPLEWHKRVKTLAEVARLTGARERKFSICHVRFEIGHCRQGGSLNAQSVSGDGWRRRISNLTCCHVEIDQENRALLG